MPQNMKPYLMMTMKFMTMLWLEQTNVSRVLLPRLAAWVSAHQWRSTMLRSLGQTQIPLQTVAAVIVTVIRMAGQTKTTCYKCLPRGWMADVPLSAAATAEANGADPGTANGHD